MPRGRISKRSVDALACRPGKLSASLCKSILCRKVRAHCAALIVKGNFARIPYLFLWNPRAAGSLMARDLAWCRRRYLSTSLSLEAGEVVQKRRPAGESAHADENPLPGLECERLGALSFEVTGL